MWAAPSMSAPLSLLFVAAVLCGSLFCTLTYLARDQQPYRARFRRRALREKLSTEEPWRDVEPPFDNCSEPPLCFQQALREVMTSGDAETERAGVLGEQPCLMPSRTGRR